MHITAPDKTRFIALKKIYNNSLKLNDNS